MNLNNQKNSKAKRVFKIFESSPNVVFNTKKIT